MSRVPVVELSADSSRAESCVCPANANRQSLTVMLPQLHLESLSSQSINSSSSEMRQES